MKKTGMVLLLVVLATLLLVTSVSAATTPGLRVQGRFLYDHLGERVILYGINRMIFWCDPDGQPSIPEMAKTGANCARLQWMIEGSASGLSSIIQLCKNNQMIPIVELHDATGDWSKLTACVDYWCRSDVVSVLQAHQQYVIVNIGNEIGDGSISDSQFKSGYETAIVRMRNAGIHVPIMIDGTDWGKNINILQANGPYLITKDVDANLLFSVHMWWPYAWGYSETTVENELQECVNMNLPIVVGEFGNKWGTGANEGIPYLKIIEACHNKQIGYLPWSWGPGNNPQTWLDMTTNSYYNTLRDWGLEVCETNTHAIHRIAVRPASMTGGSPPPVATPSPTATPTATITSSVVVTPTSTVTSSVAATPTVTPTTSPVSSPGSVYVIYEDTLNGWSDWSWTCTNDFNNSTPVYSGVKSVKVTMTGGWGCFSPHHNASGASTSGYTNFTFYIHGGTAGGQNLKFWVEDSAGYKTQVMVNSYIEGGSVAANVWRKVTIPFTALGAVGISVTRCNLQDASGTTLPVFYLDKIQYEGAGTGATPTVTPTATVTPSTAVSPTNTATATVTPSTAATPTSTPTPTASASGGTSYYVYTDSLASDWANWSWSCTANFSNSSPVKNGSYSISANYTASNGGFSVRKGTAVSGYSSVRFWVYATTSKSMSFYTQSADSSGQSTIVPFSTTANTWVEITVTMSQLGNPTAIKRLNFTSSSTGLVYFDDIRFVQ